MGLFGFWKRAETLLTVVTQEEPGRLRINGFRGKDDQAKRSAIAHERTVCWIELDLDGMRLDEGVGRWKAQGGQAERLLRDLPAMPTGRAVLDRLREGRESVSKWFLAGEPVGRMWGVA